LGLAGFAGQHRGVDQANGLVARSRGDLGLLQPRLQHRVNLLRALRVSLELTQANLLAGESSASVASDCDSSASSAST
jgi:hypothetical protein